VQIHPGTGYHREADVVPRGLRAHGPGAGSLVMIENVGNPGGPALLGLGETARVAIVSVKCPEMVQGSHLIVPNETDLVSRVAFDVPRSIAEPRALNPNLAVLRPSARTGKGPDGGSGWIRRRLDRTAHRIFAAGAAAAREAPQP
jgi:hydrogenase nickel incorporation protein HypB